MAQGQIIVKSGEVPVRRVLTVHERKALETQVMVFGYGSQTGENFINGAQGASPTMVPWLNVNRPKLNDQQKQVKRVLDEGTAQPTSPEQRDRISKRIGELTEKILPYFQSRKEIRSYSYRDPDHITALEKAELWGLPQDDCGGRTPEDLYQERANLCRMLEPDNKNAGNMEKFRAK